MSEHDKKVYMDLQDPNNPVMHVMKYGGDEALQEIYRKDIWESIRQKHRLLHAQSNIEDVENVFLNGLNEQEYAEFVRSKPADLSISKYMQSGMASEFLQADHQREKVAFQKKEL